VSAMNMGSPCVDALSIPLVTVAGSTPCERGSLRCCSISHNSSHAASPALVHSLLLTPQTNRLLSSRSMVRIHQGAFSKSSLRLVFSQRSHGRRGIFQAIDASVCARCAAFFSVATAAGAFEGAFLDVGRLYWLQPVESMK
jgi:hypothetical protein